jgi:hypothetical protein
MSTRQFYNPNEDASFAKVQGIMLAAASAALDPDAVARLVELKRWTHAARTTRRQSVNKSVLLRFIDDGQMPPMSADELEHFPDRAPPGTLLDRFFNIEHLHWDSEEARLVEARPKDEFRDAMERFDFLTCAIGLAHLYVGYAELVRHAAGLAD